MCQQLDDVASDVDKIGFESGEDGDEASFEGTELVRKTVSGFCCCLEGVLQGAARKQPLKMCIRVGRKIKRTSSDQTNTPFSQLSSLPTESKIVTSLDVIATLRCKIVKIIQPLRERMVGTTVGTFESSLRRSRGGIPNLAQSSCLERGAEVVVTVPGRRRKEEGRQSKPLHPQTRCRIENASLAS